MLSIRFCWVSSLALATLLVGCGGGIGPMDSAQKDRFRVTLGHVATVVDGLSSSNTRVQSVLKAVGQLESLDNSSVEKQKLRRAMSDALSSGACLEHDNFKQAMGGSTFSGPLTMTINGDKCPLEFALNVNGTATKTDMDLQFELGYAVKTDEFRQVADIDGVHFKGSLLAKGANGDGGHVEMSLEGDLHSRTEKDLGLYLNLNVDAVKGSGSSLQGQGELAFGIKFQDFTGELKIKGGVNGDQKQETHYYVNEEEVSASDFQDYFRDFDSLSVGKSLGW